jgi:hypothetical protein
MTIPVVVLLTVKGANAAKRQMINRRKTRIV